MQSYVFETVLWYKEVIENYSSAVFIAWSKEYVRFEGLIAVTMNNALFWNMTVCSLIGL